MEINRRARRLTPEEKVSIVEDYNIGMPILDIMTKNDISLSTVYRVLKAMEKKEV